MKILGIESSCDETAASVVEDGRVVLSNVIASQVEEHKIYGGVVPEIASRRHTEAICGVIDKALEDANCTLNDIDALAEVMANWTERILDKNLISQEAIAVYKKERMAHGYKEIYDEFVHGNS